MGAQPVAAQAPAKAPKAAAKGTQAKPAPGATAGKRTDERSLPKFDEAMPDNGLPFNKFLEFSAIGNGAIIPGHDDDVHIYRSGRWMRVEDDRTLVPGYYVSDVLGEKSTGVTPYGDCIKMGVPYSRTFPFMLTRTDLKVVRKDAGEETIDGHACKIEDFDVTADKPAIHFHFKAWEAQDLQGFPIKIQNNIPSMKEWVITFKNVVLGPQDKTLFIVPSACQSTEGFTMHKPAATTPPANPAGKPQAPPDKPE